MSDTNPASQPIRFPIGTIDGVVFDVVAWGPAQANVDFSVACMFEHEMGHAGMTGGLLALDTALGGHLSQVRAAGVFRAQPMETLLVASPRPGLAARTVLVIGLGDPVTLDGERLQRACCVAMREAICHGARTMAFAPSVLDAGHLDNAALNMQEVMLAGMLEALRAKQMLAAAGLTAAPMLRHCTFDVGAPRAAAAAQAFVAAFARLTSPARQAASGPASCPM